MITNNFIYGKTLTRPYIYSYWVIVEFDIDIARLECQINNKLTLRSAITMVVQLECEMTRKIQLYCETTKKVVLENQISKILEVDSEISKKIQFNSEIN